MGDKVYGTLGRYGLASSHSYLDGVPFKIGPNFKPPSEIELPPELVTGNVHRAQDVQYSFENEEAVLAWAKARDEAFRQAAEEQEKRRRLAEEEERQRLAEQEDEVFSDASGEEEIDVNDEQCDAAGIYDVPKSHLVNHSVAGAGKPLVPPKPAGPKSLSEPNTILKPIPIQPASSGVNHVQKHVDNNDQQAKAATSQFDVSMFEQESDPFDNLELQTINDMEELKLLLEPTNKISSEESQTVQTNTGGGIGAQNNNTAVVKDASAGEGFYDIASSVTPNNWVKFDEEETSVKSSIDEVVSKVNSNGIAPVVEGEYVEIDQNYKHTVVSFQNHQAVNGGHVPPASFAEVKSEKPSDTQSHIGGKLANSKLYKPVLPPIPGPKPKPEDNSVQTGTNAVNPFSGLPAPQSNNPFLSSNVFTSTQNSVSNNPFVTQTNSQFNTELQSTKPIALNKSAVRVLPGPPPVAKKPAMSRSQTEDSSSPRMWSSMGPSSLAGSLDDSSVVASPRSLPNPYSRHSVSTTDLHTEPSRKSPVLNPLSSSPLPTTQNAQPINRLRPLPPTPHQKPEVSTPPHPSRPAPIGLSDPYHSLSREAQAFTDSLASMGFHRARVARAVQKFGQDEKEVLDHLLAVDQLVEKKHAPVMAELALQNYKNDIAKAEKFLQMQSQFEELGFKSESIRDALMTADMDHDKALDLLTA